MNALLVLFGYSWDGRHVSIQLLFCEVLLQGFVQDWRLSTVTSLLWVKIFLSIAVCRCLNGFDSYSDFPVLLVIFKDHLFRSYCYYYSWLNSSDHFFSLRLTFKRKYLLMTREIIWIHPSPNHLATIVPVSKINEIFLLLTREMGVNSLSEWTADFYSLSPTDPSVIIPTTYIFNKRPKIVVNGLKQVPITSNDR